MYFNKEELQMIHDACFWNGGGEGDIYRIFLEKRKRILLKLFYNPFEDSFLLKDEVLKNKKRKVEVLKQIVLPNQTQVLDSISLDGQFIGYAMTEAIDYQPFTFNTCSSYQKIIFLTKLRNQLIRFHQLGVIHGDLKSDNVLSHYSNYRLGCLCDLDNMQVENLPIDTYNVSTEQFVTKYGRVDENLDWYLFNLLTLEQLYYLDKNSSISFEEVKNFIRHYQGNSKTVKEMTQITPDYSGSILLEDPNFYEELDLSPKMVSYVKKRTVMK